MNSHRWQRATITDLEYGRICGCGALKDQQALRCRSCYADARRNDKARTCVECGGPKSRHVAHPRCRSCADRLLLGNQHATGRRQPQSHPWRKKVAA